MLRFDGTLPLPVVDAATALEALLRVHSVLSDHALDSSLCRSTRDCGRWALLWRQL
jgi:hypothetical protein